MNLKVGFYRCRAAVQFVLAYISKFFKSRGSCKTLPPRKIDDFEACFGGSANRSSSTDGSLPQRAGEEVMAQDASKGRFFCGGEFCNCLSSLVRSILNQWLDLIFPPLCKICKEPCETRLFCPECWEMCSLPDPLGRCRHCFEEIEEEICRHCRQKAWLPFPSAYVFEPTSPAFHLCSMRKEAPETLAAFSLIQWERLDWPVPDVVVPLPKASKIARVFASWLDCFFADVIDEWRGEWNCRASILEEEARILLISVDHSYEDVKKAIEAISEAFPKKIFVLSLTKIFREGAG